MKRPEREVRARHDGSALTVYQAFRPEIAERAAAIGRFGEGFSLNRMTWIKPSFLWMAYRSGWATKLNQERVLAIEISRAGFEEALSGAALSQFDPQLHTSHEAWMSEMEGANVRVQWDPERNVRLEPLPWRAIQVGLSGTAVRRYSTDWILAIRDVTSLVRSVAACVAAGDLTAAESQLPREEPLPLPAEICRRLGLNP
jgi:hypothetical protein